MRISNRILAGVPWLLTGSLIVIGLCYLLNYGKPIILPTAGLETQMSALAIASKYGVQVEKMGIGEAHCYKIEKSAQFVTIAMVRIPYFIHNEPEPGMNTAMIDPNSKSASNVFFVYDPVTFKNKYGIIINGVKFNSLPEVKEK